MYLTEYLKMRGVNANALTNAEAALLGIDIGEKGWVERNAHVAVPEALANAVRNGAKKVELRALATANMQRWRAKKKLNVATKGNDHDDRCTQRP